MGVYFIILFVYAQILPWKIFLIKKFLNFFQSKIKQKRNIQNIPSFNISEENLVFAKNDKRLWHNYHFLQKEIIDSKP